MLQDMGEVAYDLDATETGPWFTAHGTHHAGYFAVRIAGTWVGTVKLQTRTPSGAVIDIDGASWTANQPEKYVYTQGGGAYAFNFTRTSGTAEVFAYSRHGHLDWADTLLSEGLSVNGNILLENNKPLITE
jgi:hypothetical protein